jgi:hypothetical protein
MQGQWYLNRVSLLFILMIILKSLFSGPLRVCDDIREGGREGERAEEKKTKIRKFKNKKKFDLQKVKNREREKKNRVLSSNSFNINVSQCNLIFIRKKQKPKLH